jgi:hypothetical protein
MNKLDVFYKLVYEDNEVYIREDHLIEILKSKNIPMEIIRVPESEGLSMIREEKISKLLGEKDN